MSFYEKYRHLFEETGAPKHVCIYTINHKISHTNTHKANAFYSNISLTLILKSNLTFNNFSKDKFKLRILPKDPKRPKPRQEHKPHPPSHNTKIIEKSIFLKISSKIVKIGINISE